jgi:hypothetical protein
LTIHRKKVFILETQTATTLPKLTLRDVDVCREKKTTVEVDWRVEKHTCKEHEIRSRQVEQEVTCTEVVPETTTDPATGKSCTVYKQVPVVKKVMVTVQEAVPVDREYLVKFPCLRRTEREMQVKKLEVDRTTIPAIEKKLHAVVAPCEITVQKNVCPFACPPKEPEKKVETK